LYSIRDSSTAKVFARKMAEKSDKKPGFMSRLFSSRKSSAMTDLTSEEEEKLKNKRLNRLFSVDATTFRNPSELFAQELTQEKLGSSAKTTGSSAGAGEHEKVRPASASTRKQSMTPGCGGSVKKPLTLKIQGNGSSPTEKSPPTSTVKSAPPTGQSDSLTTTKKSSLTSPTKGPPSSGGRKASLQTSMKSPLSSPTKTPGGGSSVIKKSGGGGGRSGKGVRHKKKAGAGQGVIGGVKVDTSKPLEFPATPETIFEYHRQKPFLNRNEEWLIVELNEYECLVDSLDIIKIIAKHSKFFEVEPDELWPEFFEFVEDVPSYDEIINYDVWQEFRDQRYPC